MRYILHPGHVYSRNDGQQHFVSAPRLAALYGVPLSRCVVVEPGRPSGFGYVERAGDVHLWPRRDGNYSLAGAVAECV